MAAASTLPPGAVVIRYHRIRLELGFVWALSRNSATYKENFIVKVETSHGVGWGEVAPNIRYGEVPDAIEARLAGICAGVSTQGELDELIGNLTLEACLLCGLTCAKRMADNTLWPKGYIKSDGLPCSFTLPIMAPGDVPAFYHKWQLHRFPALKVKVGKGDDNGTVRELGKLYDGPVWIDANEGYHTLEELDAHVADWQRHVRLVVVEQPFPAVDIDKAKGLKGRYAGIDVIADESLVPGCDMEALAASYDGVNIKLQKAGDLGLAQHQLEQARSLGLKIMIGCMVETSVGIAHALPLAASAHYCDLDSMLYLTQEPYGWVREEGGRLYVGEGREPF